ncbi:hypothetical protein ACOMHN_006714 [Nucella lapillus]
MDTWTELLDSGSNVDVIYMDFQKAFDSVPHRRLILKLEAHGIKQQVLQWITAFLSNRKQQVVLKDTHSQEADVTSGIPHTRADTCGKCDEPCKDDQNSLQCELCDIWYHTTCENIDEATYQILKKDSEKKAVIHYYCSKTCNNAAVKFLRGLLKIEKDVESLQAKMTEVDTKLANIQEGKFTQGMIQTGKEITLEHNQENKTQAAQKR